MPGVRPEQLTRFTSQPVQNRRDRFRRRHKHHRTRGICQPDFGVQTLLALPGSATKCVLASKNCSKFTKTMQFNIEERNFFPLAANKKSAQISEHSVAVELFDLQSRMKLYGPRNVWEKPGKNLSSLGKMNAGLLLGEFSVSTRRIIEEPECCQQKLA